MHIYIYTYLPYTLLFKICCVMGLGCRPQIQMRNRVNALTVRTAGNLIVFTVCTKMRRSEYLLVQAYMYEAYIDIGPNRN